MTAAADARNLRMNIEPTRDARSDHLLELSPETSCATSTKASPASTPRATCNQPGAALGASPDNLRWRFFLRPNVKFHSGNNSPRATSSNTFEQLLLPGNRGGLGVGYLERVAGVRGDAAPARHGAVGRHRRDDLTVEIRMTAPTC